MNNFTSTRRKVPSVRPVMVAVLASFLLGGAIAGYAVYTLTDRDEPTTQPATVETQSLASPTSEPTPPPSASPAAHAAVDPLADQQGGVGLICGLGDGEYTRFAIAHKDVIARFGRFPHRNGILDRPSTPEEQAFLAQPGSSF